AMRLDRELEAGLDDRAGDRVMPATGAQRRDRALVVPVRIAERILRQVGVMEFRLRKIGHEVTFIGFTVSLSRWAPIALAMKRAVICVPALWRIGTSRTGSMPHSLTISERSCASRFCSTTNTKSWSATKLLTLE